MNKLKMERKALGIGGELKASMWGSEGFESFECYAKANSNTRKDAESCLQEYSPRFKWNKKSRVLDIGCGDGSVTKIIAKHIPDDVELVASDVHDKALKFANHKYGDGRIQFMRFDVIGHLPLDMIGKFDHVFAMYVFHWIQDHETAFTNIYKILPKNGEFFAIFLGHCDIYSIFQILAKKKKWSEYMKNIDQFLSLYHDYEDPDIAIERMLKKIGFGSVDVKCKQRYCTHESIAVFKDLLTGINCFDIPKESWPEFMDDYVETQRFMNLIDAKGLVRTNYNLFVIHCIK
ncbi:juvenile hormone acid O-methyltransferase [Manduca sexta]|nr:juvenile hormone acid O-methyltransferase [Manduca sexta]